MAHTSEKDGQRYRVLSASMQYKLKTIIFSTTGVAVVNPAKYDYGN